MLTALIGGPSFDPLLRPDVIDVPPHHPVFAWGCMVTGCQRTRTSNKDICARHQTEWAQASREGMDRLGFLRTAQPYTLYFYDQELCWIPECARPARRRSKKLCQRHFSRWESERLTAAANGWHADYDTWRDGQLPLPSYGNCRAASCRDRADSPLLLCTDHGREYRNRGKPGGAALPQNWGHSGDLEVSAIGHLCR
ncbi:hypothetical protein AB0H37_43790 [Actinomadura sp. NPDC023710]|uniref:hypothetical protein n=1 Tax=Actinomadura sp. NPDC023710 TaxID=3158219 RepID=UPI0033D275CF